MRRPVVIGMNLSDGLEYSEAGRVSLGGIVHSFTFAQFPTPPRTLSVYCALFDGVGAGLAEVIVTRLYGELDISRFRRWVKMPGRFRYLNLEMKISKLYFPTPGRYQILLLIDQQELARRFLDIFGE